MKQLTFLNYMSKAGLNMVVLFSLLVLLPEDKASSLFTTCVLSQPSYHMQDNQMALLVGTVIIYHLNCTGGQIQVQLLLLVQGHQEEQHDLEPAFLT